MRAVIAAVACCAITGAGLGAGAGEVDAARSGGRGDRHAVATPRPSVAVTASSSRVIVREALELRGTLRGFGGRVDVTLQRRVRVFHGIGDDPGVLVWRNVSHTTSDRRGRFVLAASFRAPGWETLRVRATRRAAARSARVIARSRLIRVKVTFPPNGISLGARHVLGGAGSNIEPTVSTDHVHGTFLAAWVELPDGARDYRIHFQLLDTNGALLGVGITETPPAGTSYRMPRVEWNPVTGRWVAAWIWERPGAFERSVVLARQLHADGTLAEPAPVAVSDDTDVFSERPEISCNRENGSCLLGWTHWPNPGASVRVLSLDGTASAAAIALAPRTANGSLDLAWSPATHSWLATWGPDGKRLVAQALDAGGALVGSPQTLIEPASGLGSVQNLEVVTNPASGDVLLGVMRSRVHSPVFEFHRYNAALTPLPLVGPVPLPDRTQIVSETWACDASGRCFAAWQSLQDPSGENPGGTVGHFVDAGGQLGPQGRIANTSEAQIAWNPNGNRWLVVAVEGGGAAVVARSFAPHL